MSKGWMRESGTMRYSDLGCVIMHVQLLFAKTEEWKKAYKCRDRKSQSGENDLRHWKLPLGAVTESISKGDIC